MHDDAENVGECEAPAAAAAARAGGVMIKSFGRKLRRQR